MVAIQRNIIMFSLCLLTLLTYSCSDVESESLNGNGQPTLTFNMTRSPRNIIDNTLIYRFDTSWDFEQKVLGVSPGTDKLSMEMPAGTWNLTLVTADTDITSKITSPVSGQARTGKMWETQALANELPPMPELRTAYLDNVGITANIQNNAGPVDLSRNVALVKVVIDKTRGLKMVGAAHEFELNNVPTTLNWAGKLMPDTDNPYVGAKPMKGTFAISNKTDGSGMQESDTLQFIIPAHKGNDYLSATPADTLKKELTFSVNLKPEGGGSDYIKTNITIPRVPRVNHILLVRLSMLSEIEVSADILDWVDVNLNAELSQTKLLLDKAEVGLAYRDTVYVNTNASTFTVEKEAGNTWLTATPNGNMVLLEANVDTYVDNQERSSYITIKAGNITKKVPVTQRPDRGTISVNNKRLVFCPVNHEQRSVQINTIGGDWKFLTQTYKATPNVQQGGNGANVTFTRASTTVDDDFDKFYGDSIIVVKNMRTLDTDTIDIVNCFIYMYDNVINANAPTGTAQSAVTVTSDVTVYGGNRNLTNFVPVESWIYGVSWNPITQEMTMTTDRAEDDEARDGTMSFTHAECSDYIVTATVHQDIIITIPPFQYLVLKYIWPAIDTYDVDIAAEFVNNGAIFDNKPVGWNMSTHGGGTTINYNGSLLLQWGGDAQNGEGETTFFNAPIIDADNTLPRIINLKTYATWYKPESVKGTPMEFEMTAYKGGTMVKGTNSTGDYNNKNYYNVGGEMLYQRKYKVVVNKYRGVDDFRNNYDSIATVVYDRIKHSATVKVHADTLPLTRSVILPNSSSEPIDIKKEIMKAQTNKVVNTYSK